MKNKLTNARIIYLENWLNENYPFDLTEEEFLEFLQKNFKKEESTYLMRAYLMPLDEVSKILKDYDNDSLLKKELAYILKLERTYHLERKEVLARIRDVRKILEYLEEHALTVVAPGYKVYNKLVRDNIPDIIQKNGEVPYVRILTSDEYWESLLAKDSEELQEVKMVENPNEMKNELADKFEVLNAMITHQGFTLEEIMKEANLKREQKGGFTKKLFLEKVKKSK